jgi:hypothetical protein
VYRRVGDQTKLDGNVLSNEVHVLVLSKCFLCEFAFLRGPFEKFMDSPYYSESELCGGAVTVSFSKYITWQAMHFLQCSTHFRKRAVDR